MGRGEISRRKFAKSRAPRRGRRKHRGREKKGTLVRAVTVEFIGPPSGPVPPLSAGILAVNQIRDLRAARVYINSATAPIIGRSLPSLGSPPARLAALAAHQRSSAAASPFPTPLRRRSSSSAGSSRDRPEGCAGGAMLRMLADPQTRAASPLPACLLRAGSDRISRQ